MTSERSRKRKGTSAESLIPRSETKEKSKCHIGHDYSKGRYTGGSGLVVLWVCTDRAVQSEI